MNIYTWIIKNRSDIKGPYIVTYLLIIIGLNVYLLNKYQVGELEIDKISLSSNLTKNDISIYINRDDGNSIDFTTPFLPELVNEKFIFHLKDNKIRNFRIYIEKKTDSLSMSYIDAIYKGRHEIMPLNEFKTNGIKKSNTGLSADLSAYFELKRNHITAFELCKVEVIILIISLLLSGFSIYIYNNYLVSFLKPFNLKVIAVSIFILSIFLPQLFFNAAFIGSFAIIVKDFNYTVFKSNKAGFLFLGYFSLFLINNLFISREFNYSLLETFLPIFFLTFYIACIPKKNFLSLFPISAGILTLYFISTSCIDYSIYQNINYFSFDNFTKYVHPVYYSYLLVFSLVYIELNSSFKFNKVVFIPILSIALLCCGSKLMISLIILFYVIRIFRKKAYLGYTFIGIVICSILLFTPTRKRFQEIVNTKSLSILKENPIITKHDARLTGLTLRLIIWQEALTTLTGAKELLLGIGVDHSANKLLEEKLLVRGVELGHTKYDPHNQFITTMYKMGLVGLGCLLIICIYYFKLAIQQKNTMLLYSIILFVTAMFTESVLQRVTGIYFFLTILLLQTILITNTTHFENSNSGNERDSK